MGDAWAIKRMVTSVGCAEQERLWKRAAARAMGMAAAAAARKGGLKRTPAGDQMQAEISKATARVCYLAEGAPCACAMGLVLTVQTTQARRSSP